MAKRDDISQVAESVPFDNTSNDFDADNVQDAIEESRETAQGFPRSGVRITANGVIGNNDWLGPNELLPNTPTAVFPVGVQINEITWSNQRDNVEFEIEFRTGSKTGTIFYTLAVTPSNPGYGFVNGLTFNFSPGDTVWAQYKDNGYNCSDFEMTLWISRIS
jgi:hypothetical protein